MFYFLIGLLVLAVVFLFMGVQIVRQGYVYTIERLGKYHKAAHRAKPLMR